MAMAEQGYRGLAREEIDRQLNLRARWPEHATYFERWAAESAAVRDGRPAHLDRAYGPSAGQRLDVFPAAERSSGGAPLLAFIHGGYWQSLDKSDFSYLAPPFVDAGLAFASINYDLAPTVRMPEIVAQVRRALAWLYRNARDLGVDPDRIAVAGHSAGGHLAVVAMATDWRAEGEDLPADLLKGGCSVSGVYDLRPIALSYQQEVLRLDEASVAAFSPLRHVPRRAGPLICAVGSEETEEFLVQQAAFVEAWRAAGLAATVVHLPGRQHFSAVDALGEDDHPLHAAVRDLLRGTAA